MLVLTNRATAIQGKPFHTRQKGGAGEATGSDWWHAHTWRASPRGHAAEMAASLRNPRSKLTSAAYSVYHSAFCHPLRP